MSFASRPVALTLGLFISGLDVAASLRTSTQVAAYHWAREHCEKNLWMTMDTCLQELTDNTSYVITGDINAMWTRDSTAQMWPYLLMLEKNLEDSTQSKSGDEAASLQHLERLLTGTLRRQAKFLLTDPYANAYTDAWDSATDQRLGRGGYVFTGNYEVDSGVYFMRFYTRLAELELRQRGAPKKKAQAAGNSMLQGSGSAGDPHSAEYSILGDSTLRSAVTMLVALYRQERDHALGKSKHQYPLSQPWELPGKDGKGNPANWTGMVWGAFRPSDDPQTYAYNIPNNMFLASVLGPLSDLAEKHWDSSEKLVAGMKDLRSTILDGVHKHGVASVPKTGASDAKVDGMGVALASVSLIGVSDAKADEKVYCYEVDGLGNCLLMDDANVPSLLSLPYLDPSRSTFDEQIYSRTRQFILSEKNPWYFKGSAGEGVGSPHTHDNQIWPLAMVMQAMTSTDQTEKHKVLTNLYQVQGKNPSKNGLSESFNKDNAASITRQWFAWPNALLSEYLMTLKPAGCSPSLADLQAHLPKEVKKAKDDGPLRQLKTEFYLAPAENLRRKEVVLPAEEYYPN